MDEHARRHRRAKILVTLMVTLGALAEWAGLSAGPFSLLATLVWIWVEEI